MNKVMEWLEKDKSRPVKQRHTAHRIYKRLVGEWYEGVPARISYDNLTTAVRKVLRGRNREEQNAFIAFRSHYLFESHFATPAQPQEQGRVESLVGYMRGTTSCLCRRWIRLKN